MGTNKLTTLARQPPVRSPQADANSPSRNTTPTSPAPADAFEAVEKELVQLLQPLADSKDAFIATIGKGLEAGVESLFDAAEPAPPGPQPKPSPRPLPKPAPPQHRDYTVKSGDTLSAIARDHGVSLAALEAANPQIANPDLIYPGEIVHLPKGTAPAPKPTPSPRPPSSGTGDAATQLAARVKQMNLRQHYDGDCSMAVISNMVLLATGKTPGEQGVVDKAVREGLGTTSNGMSPPAREQLLREYGLDPKTTYGATVNDLAREVAAGRAVNVAVNAPTLRNNDPHREGPLGHVINVVGVKKDGSAFQVVDTGQWPPGMRWVSRQVMQAAMNDNNSVMQSVSVRGLATPKPVATGRNWDIKVPGAAQALSWARGFLGTRQYEDLCGSFCYQAYARGAGRGLSSEWNDSTAARIADNLRRSGKLRPYDPHNPPPPGAILFYPADGNNTHFGHVVLCTDKPNQVLSTGWPAPPTPVRYWDIASLSAAEGTQPAGWIVP